MIVKLERSSISMWLQYLYFLRFPILGWLTLPLLCYLDAFTGMDALTRGIMTLDSIWQALYVAFFAPALAMAVLICAKNIVRNGEERFDSKAPSSLECFLCEPNRRPTWIALVAAHVPTLLTLTYVAYATVHEKECVRLGPGYWQLWVGYVLGLSLAFVFWELVSLFYFWLQYVPADRSEEATTSIIFAPLLPTPMRLALCAQNADRPNYAVFAERITRLLLILSCRGYACDRDSNLWPLHLLTLISLGSFLILYFFLYPLIAPVYFSSGWVQFVLTVLVYAAAVYGARSRSGLGPIAQLFVALETLLVLLLLSLLVWNFTSKHVHMETAFPVLASLLVIFIFFQWLFSGASFFFDRFRIPVLTSVLAMIVLPKFLPFDQDHYFEVLPTEKATVIDSPSQAIDDRVSKADEPYIIVTATGGGIRAAEWTALIMAELEQKFSHDPTLQLNQYTFHDHLLLASGVSGGSNGLMPYLLEYTAKQPFTGNEHDLRSRLTRAPGCSSLEAVAWGLEYYDLQRFLFTYRPSWLKNANATDRTWALTEAFNRNLKSNSPDCPFENTAWPEDMLDGKSLTLKGAAEKLHGKSFPAFTFNTTVAETGGRFLLSNYQVPPMPAEEIGKTDFLPAESFLQAYAQESNCDAAQVKKDCYADLSLATAARLSATFPVVSSATRLPPKYAAAASHLLDGGYYDNDGTASVTEFLYSALEARQRQVDADTKKTSTPKPQTKRVRHRAHASAAQATAPPAPPSTSASPRPPDRLRILLVEIRDGNDMDPTQNVDNWDHQIGNHLEAGVNGPTPWRFGNQLASPLQGLWNAGHESTTRRNRRELCLLERTYHDHKQGNDLEIHHVVIGIPAEKDQNRPNLYKTPPLNWKLTASQQRYIEKWSQDASTQKAISDAVGWVGRRLPNQNVDPVTGRKPEPQTHDGYPACEVDDQTYMRPL